MAQPYNALFQQMLVEFEKQNFDVADRLAQSILCINPKDVVALQILGLTLAIRGAVVKAIEPLAKAAALAPKNPELLTNLARAQFGSKLYEEAIKTFEKLNRIAPNNSQILTDKGTTHGKLRQFDLAAACYDKAIALDPTYYLVWSNYGNLWSEQGYPGKAIEYYETALKYNPNYPETWTNYGNALFDLGRLEESRLKHEKALELNPLYGEAWSNHGNALQELKLGQQSIVSYQKAYDLVPDHPFLIGHLFNAYRNVCDWEKSEPLAIKGIELVSQGNEAIEPFILLQTSASLAMQKQAAQTYIRARVALSETYGFPNLQAIENRKIRIGYFSSDFKEHPVGILMENLIELHDRSRFEINGYWLNKKTGDELESRLLKIFDHSCNLFSMTDQEARKLILEHEIDIAIDLNGRTAGARTALFARKIAPVQVGYLGYAGTSGADFYQYLIADPIVIPQEDQTLFTEEVLYLPNSFFPADSLIQLGDFGELPTRASQGLPETGVIFSCFNHPYKISPGIFNVWMKLLKQIPESILWLSKTSLLAMNNLRQHAHNNDIDPSRVIFATREDRRVDHLSRLRLADLFLDTFYFNAHTTAADSLWAGVPVLTLRGNTFASRVAASQLTAMGLPELITQSVEQYFSKAKELAEHPELLKSLRLKLEANRQNTPLFDTKKYVSDLEALYISTLERHV
ncbi:MAG TPA: hypothetical protein DCW35_08820 [Polynucleobacter sp.]|nr:hypothetical protein [Polynucleobacter sp.]